jgi:hypothetical protein
VENKTATAVYPSILTLAEGIGKCSKKPRKPKMSSNAGSKLVKISVSFWNCKDLQSRNRKIAELLKSGRLTPIQNWYGFPPVVPLPLGEGGSLAKGYTNPLPSPYMNVPPRGRGDILFAI